MNGFIPIKDNDPRSINMALEALSKQISSSGISQQTPAKTQEVVRQTLINYGLINNAPSINKAFASLPIATTDVNFLPIVTPNLLVKMPDIQVNIGPLAYALDAEYNGSEVVYTEIKTIAVPFNGTYRVKASIHSVGGGAISYCKIYVNWPGVGGPVGVEHTNANASYSEFTDDVTVKAGDAISVYCKTNYADYFVKNFRVYSNVGQWAVITDKTTTYAPGNVPIMIDIGGGGGGE
jgi:hypothetical protein